MQDHISMDGPVCPYCDYVAEPRMVFNETVSCPICERPYLLDTEITWYTRWVNEPRKSWDEFFASPRVSDDFMSERDQLPPQERESLDDDEAP